ncbi:putative low molecular weight protein-tyrosine-phosphatase AmsI [Pseudomonas fluorescens]|nr:putative low molecular weight protein-tyrosine-phosphatase AmsI [Pseudomonas fluorescens]
MAKCFFQASIDGIKEVVLFKNILVVCIGNICRSPTAENLLRKALEPTDIVVRSAGLHALKNSPIEATALSVLEEHGHVPHDHRATQLTSAGINESDLILVMEHQHINAILQMAPAARGKIFLLGKWQDEREIKDPYRQGKPAFLHAYALIEAAVHAWAKRLAR